MLTNLKLLFAYNYGGNDSEWWYMVSSSHHDHQVMKMSKLEFSYYLGSINLRRKTEK